MITILSIFGVIVFIAGAYLMGNAAMKTFDDTWDEQLISSLSGLLIWIGIGLVGLLCYGIYIGIYTLLLNAL